MKNNININDKNKFLNQRFKGINANTLRFLAILFMLIDHMWATIVPGNQWMNYVGRMAFPIFAFQVSEGFIHTSNLKKYAVRLFLFALISEIPFNLFYGGSAFYPFYQNVLFTLFLGLLAIGSIERMRREYTFKSVSIAIFALISTCFLATIFFVDYGAKGVLTVVAFYLFRNFHLAWIGQLISLVLLNIVCFQGMYIPIKLLGITFEFQTQGFAVLSLIPIWLYNGKRGKKNPILQYSSYIFYPLHIFILYLIYSFVV